MKRISFTIDDQLHKRFKMFCAEKDVRMADLIRDYIISIVGKKEGV
jgi:hypothetical protein